MEESTIDERKRWWLLCYATTSIEKTKATCRLIQATCDGEVTPMFEALSLAVHAYYARPFVKNFGVGRLENEIVPEDHLGIHAWLMDFRSRTMVHTDSTDSEESGSPMNQVIYTRHSGRQLFTTMFPAAPVSAYEDVLEHCDVMTEVFKSHLRRFHRDFGHLIPVSDGDHLLSLELGSPTFIEGYVAPTRSLLHYK